MDIVRVFRLIEYYGPRKWIEDTISKSIQGEKLIYNGYRIRATTLGTYPEIMEQKQEQEMKGDPHVV